MATIQEWISKIQSYDPVKFYNKINQKYGNIGKATKKLYDLYEKYQKLGQRDKAKQYSDLATALAKKYNEGRRAIAEQNFVNEVKKYNPNVDQDKINNVLKIARDKYGKSGQLYETALQKLQDSIKSKFKQNVSVNKSKYYKLPPMPKGDYVDEEDIERARMQRSGYIKAWNDFSRMFNDYAKKVEKIFGDVKQQVGKQAEEIQKIKSFNNWAKARLNTTMSLIQQKDNLYNQTFKALQQNLNDIAKQYGETYSKITERINKYEDLVNKQFNAMKQNLQQIGENYKKILEYNTAAAGATVEKKLAGLTGKGAALRVANYLQQVRQQADKNFAELQNNLLNSLNNLETQYLNLQRAIMQDKNINDKEKVQVLDNLKQRLNQLITTKQQLQEQLINKAYEPINEVLDIEKQEEVAKKQVILKQYLTKLDAEWQQYSEPYRLQAINSIIGQLVGKVKVPKSIVDKALKAPTLTDALVIISNHIASNNNSISYLQKLLESSKEK